MGKDALACRPWRNFRSGNEDKAYVSYHAATHSVRKKREEDESAPSNLVLLEGLLNLLEVSQQSNLRAKKKRQGSKKSQFCILFTTKGASEGRLSNGRRGDNSLSVAILWAVLPSEASGPRTSQSIFLEYVCPVTG